MTAAGIKTELQRMIEEEKDIKVLEAIHRFLEDSRLDPNLREKLMTRALQSEEDIKKGRLHSKDEIIQRTSRLVGMKFKNKNPAS